MLLASDSKVHGADMGPIWGRQDPGGPMVAPWTLLSGERRYVLWEAVLLYATQPSYYISVPTKMERSEWIMCGSFVKKREKRTFV